MVIETTGEAAQGEPSSGEPIVDLEKTASTSGDALPEGLDDPAPPPEPGHDALDLAKRFNQLTYQEKEFRSKQDALKADQDSVASYKEALDNLKNNPLEALRAAGHEFKDLAEMVLNDEKPTDSQIQKGKLDSLEERFLADIESRNKEKESAKELEATASEESNSKIVEQANETIKDMIETAEDGKFDLIKSQNQQGLVMEVINDVFKETQQVIPFEEAAEKVEAHLEAEIEKYLDTSKFKSRYKKIDVVDEDEPVDTSHNYYLQKMMEEKYGNSLSNDMVADSSKPPPAVNKNSYLSDEDMRMKMAYKLQKKIDARKAQ